MMMTTSAWIVAVMSVEGRAEHVPEHVGGWWPATVNLGEAASAEEVHDPPRTARMATSSALSLFDRGHDRGELVKP